MQRSILSGFWATVCIGGQMMLFVYFIPVWFQAIKGISAIDSGIRLLPLCLPMVAFTIISGIAITRIGYYTPFMIAGNVLMAVGAGLLTTFQVDTEQAVWIGYMVLYGSGLGMTFQAPNLAAQTVLPTDDVPIGTSLMFFSQQLGGAIFISVGQNVLNNQLVERLSPLPGFNPGLLAENGATTLITKLPEAIRDAVLYEYNESLRKVFQVAVILTCLTMIGSVAMEWKSVKKDVKKKGMGEAEEGKGKTESGTSNTTTEDVPGKDNADRGVGDVVAEKKGEVQEVRVPAAVDEDGDRRREEGEKREEKAVAPEEKEAKGEEVKK